jgi:cytochrome c5
MSAISFQMSAQFQLCKPYYRAIAGAHLRYNPAVIQSVDQALSGLRPRKADLIITILKSSLSTLKVAMKFFSLIAACALVVVSIMSATASHNTSEALEARVSAVGTLNVSEGSSDSGNSETEGPVDGESVYNTSCAACHGTGVGGAPAVGDSANWEDRIAQGIETLSEHALQGYTGQSGVMPAKGGNPSLSDDAVTAAVQFMVDQSQ